MPPPLSDEDESTIPWYFLVVDDDDDGYQDIVAMGNGMGVPFTGSFDDIAHANNSKRRELGDSSRPVVDVPLPGSFDENAGDGVDDQKHQTRQESSRPIIDVPLTASLFEGKEEEDAADNDNNKLRSGDDLRIVSDTNDPYNPDSIVGAPNTENLRVDTSNPNRGSNDMSRTNLPPSRNETETSSFSYRTQIKEFSGNKDLPKKNPDGGYWSFADYPLYKGDFCHARGGVCERVRRWQNTSSVSSSPSSRTLPKVLSDSFNLIIVLGCVAVSYVTRYGLKSILSSTSAKDSGDATIKDEQKIKEAIDDSIRKTKRKKKCKSKKKKKKN